MNKSVKLSIVGLFSIIAFYFVYPYLYFLFGITLSRVLPSSTIWSNEFMSEHVGEFAPMNKRYACGIAKNEWVGKKGRTIYTFTGDRNSISTLRESEPRIANTNEYFSDTLYIKNLDDTLPSFILEKCRMKMY